MCQPIVERKKRKATQQMGNQHSSPIEEDINNNNNNGTANSLRQDSTSRPIPIAATSANVLVNGQEENSENGGLLISNPAYPAESYPLAGSPFTPMSYNLGQSVSPSDKTQMSHSSITSTNKDNSSSREKSNSLQDSKAAPRAIDPIIEEETVSLVNLNSLPIEVSVDSEGSIATLVNWTGGGNEVYVTGSFNKWASRVPLTTGGNSNEPLSAVLYLQPGTHRIIFLVDGELQHCPELTTAADPRNQLVNILEVAPKSSSFVVDSHPSSSFRAPSPVGIYGDGLYSRNVPEFLLSSSAIPNPHLSMGQSSLIDSRQPQVPPMLPPQLTNVLLNTTPISETDYSTLPYPQHVTLNHLYAQSVRDGIMALGTTTRYRQKFVTIIESTLFNRCLELSKQCPASETAYSVGCLIVDAKSNKIISEAYSRQDNGPSHAEELALQRMNPNEELSDQIDQIDIYTTMEPCSRRLSGRECCTDKLLRIKDKIGRVIVGIREPKRFISNCTGIEQLTKAGIKVILLDDERCCT